MIPGDERSAIPSPWGIRVVAVLLCFWLLVWATALLLVSGVRPDILLPIALLAGMVWPLVVDYRWRLDACRYAGAAIKASVSPAFFGWQGAVKRAMDIAIAIGLLALLSPLFFVIAIAILLEDGRPIFSSVNCMGRDMRPFRQFRFRTLKRAVIDTLPGSLQPVWDAKDDQRVLRVGSVVRRLSLDSLPAFWNVLRGEMSVIGPRAERAELVDAHRSELWTLATFFVRPGIAGASDPSVRWYAPVRSAANESFSALQYVHTWTLWVDVKALWVLLLGLFSIDEEPPRDSGASALDRLREIMRPA